MKYLRKFDSVADMNAAIASSEIDILGLAYNGSTPVMRIKSGGSPVPPTPSTSTPFYVENIINEVETLTIAGYDWMDEDNYLEIPVEYSTDGTNWSSWGTTGETALTRTLQPGDKVYLRATTDAWYEYQEDEFGEGQIEHGCTISGVSKVGGNIMSLLYGSNFSGNETAFPSGSDSIFLNLFNDMNDEEGSNRNLVSASELILPATTLTPNCYGSMFSSCISLTAAPAILPATTLAEDCYFYMFTNCISLTAAPALPATTLAGSCYSDMFAYCSSLTTAPALPATTLAESCYGNMFEGCTSLTTAPALPATTLAEGCYQSMFGGCESLTSAPALPATTLTEGCYKGMFESCMSLTAAPALPATTLASACYSEMFNNCTALTTAPALPATTLVVSCYAGMFNGCTSLTTAPALPATTLVRYCYIVMFNGCTNLNYIKCLATNISTEECTTNWTDGVAASGTFVKDPNMSTSTWGSGSNGIPSGWTVEDAQD